MSRFKRFIREPLVHFLVLGAGLFLAYGLVGNHTSGEPGRIVVTRGQVEALVTGFTRTWQRPPSDEEVAGLIQEHVREEVYAREAIALGLDKDDTIIRQRLRQKMEFLNADVAAPAEPTDDDLRSYLKEHPDSFGEGPRFTFSQVHLDPARRKATLAQDIEQLLASLRKSGGDADITGLGDPPTLERSFESVSADEVEQRFGGQFEAALSRLRPGQWDGPVESVHGVHLVFLRQRTAGDVPEFEKIKNAIRREWTTVKRREMNEKAYQGMLSHYSVSIEQPVEAVMDGAK